MGEVTFTGETLRYAKFFTSITKTNVVDCVEVENRLIFVVSAGEIGKAIGKGGENVTLLRKKLGKDVYVIEFSNTPETFIRNVFRAYDVKKVEIEERGDVIHATVTVAATEKGRAIGRDGRNLRVARDLIARHHPIQSVSVA
jgi:N utilization substance protein A